MMSWLISKLDPTADQSFVMKLILEGLIYILQAVQAGISNAANAALYLLTELIKTVAGAANASEFFSYITASADEAVYYGKLAEYLISPIIPPIMVNLAIPATFTVLAYAMALRIALWAWSIIWSGR